MSEYVRKLEAAVADLGTISRALRVPLDTSSVDAALRDLVESLRPKAEDAPVAEKPEEDSKGRAGEARPKGRPEKAETEA